jgi:DNA-binding PucR family transcriptional regulator
LRGAASSIRSYDQALRTADVAATVSTFGEVVCWDDLGIYQMLTEMPIDQLQASPLHAGLADLLDHPRAPELLPTLERYLDLAGDVQETAASLYVHRTTLYHRLRRIEQLARVSLSNGDDRLALHLSLKVARLQGRTWPMHVDERT